MKNHPMLLALWAGLAAAPALASDDCDVPLSQWQSRKAVMQMAAQRGWQVQRLKIDDGCYEIRGRDAQGREFKAKLDPQTLRVVKMKARDGENERSRERERERSHDRSASAPSSKADGGNTGAPAAMPAPAAAPNPVFKPGTKPSASIE